MYCDACERMHLCALSGPHSGLVTTRAPSTLRPLGRQRIIVLHYTCRLCGTNWLAETESTGARQEVDWVCLGRSGNILDPDSVPRSPAATLPDSAVLPTPRVPLDLFMSGQIRKWVPRRSRFRSPSSHRVS